MRSAIGLLALSLSCRSSGSPVQAPPPLGQGGGGEFAIVAEGPCSRLFVESITQGAPQGGGDRVFLAYGGTGLGDVTPAPATQALAELRGSSFVYDPSLTLGLPRDAKGWVFGNLELGGEYPDAAWLLRTVTVEAPPRTGALFDYQRSWYLWSASDHQWQAVTQELKERARKTHRRPEMPRSAPLCDERAPEGGTLKFVPQASSELATGEIWVVGTCQPEGPIRLDPPRVLVASYAPGDPAWRFDRVPVSFSGESQGETLSHLANFSVFGHARGDAYLIAWAPYAGVDAGKPFLAHFDGDRWRVLDTPLQGQTTSLSGSSDGTIWIAAGGDAWSRSPQGAWQKHALPAPLFNAEVTLRVREVRVVRGSDVWLEGWYKTGPHARSHALLRRGAGGMKPVYCDMSERPDRALRER